MNEVVPKTEDTAAQPQQPDAPQMEIEVVDTASPAPEVEAPVAPAPTQPLIAGKFRTPEEAAKAYEEAQRAMHEAKMEAATLRKVIDERQAQPTPAYHEPPVNFGEKFREQLADDPFGTLTGLIDFRARQLLEQKEAAQRELVKKYQSFSSRPEYADIAQEVAAELPFANQQPMDPIEALFLRKKMQKMEAAMAGGMTAPVNPQFVESGGVARRAGAGSLRVELDPDTAKLRSLGNDKMRDLARIVAKQKVGGGTMREMSIDDWEKTNA